MSSSGLSVARASGTALAAILVGLLLIPLLALGWASTPAELLVGASHPSFGPSLWLSLKTSVVSVCVVVATGTPLSWWLARSVTKRVRAVEFVLDVPVVLPPAVVGVALLEAFGRRGMLGDLLLALDVTLPFTSAAVVVAQIVVSAPFYVQAAVNAFRPIAPELLLVSRTLGMSTSRTFLRVVVPIALPGLLGGVALCWARALGEFGATLLFAGNLPGTTQTVPLAIYAALESDVRTAVALSLALAAILVALLFALRALPLAALRWLARRDGTSPGSAL